MADRHGNVENRRSRSECSLPLVRAFPAGTERSLQLANVQLPDRTCTSAPSGRATTSQHRRNLFSGPRSTAFCRYEALLRFKVRYGGTVCADVHIPGDLGMLQSPPDASLGVSSSAGEVPLPRCAHRRSAHRRRAGWSNLSQSQDDAYRRSRRPAASFPCSSPACTVHGRPAR